MLVAGINGSANSQGNTGVLIQRVLSGVTEAGADTLTFDLGQMNISPCRACMVCKANQTCVNPDDMGEFYAEASRLDRLVIGTPIYMDHVSAQLKIFFDRLYCYLGSDMQNHYPGGRQAVLCITYGDRGDTKYDYVLEWMQGRLSDYFQIETLGILKKDGCPETVIVDQDSALMEAAFDLGRRLAT